ncbi:methylated-DNA--[protein]-cysteine S-methyltransferase [Photobacterium nomapromontoriensis]|uniref:methylated-DNA--[protein]-cysteine S-methyltransferase n=1 Tax=Photobacterium nomapromontoriensis TaxID=2910237 RepID=UPI003D0F9A5E
MYYDYLDSVLGKVYLLADEQGLRQLTIASGGFTPHSHWEHNPQFMAPFISQLTEYLDGKRKQFTLPLAPQGTEFQRQVWHALVNIPYNSQYSYQQIAETLNQPCAILAIGTAKNVNPIPIIIPCHRVASEVDAQDSCRYGQEMISQLRALEKGELSLL